MVGVTLYFKIRNQLYYDDYQNNITIVNNN